MITLPVRVKMKMAASRAVLAMTVSSDRVRVPTKLSVGYYASQYPGYSGEYAFTPGETEQTVPTAEKVLMHDLVIAPIPRNYGRIDYNGSIITVW